MKFLSWFWRANPKFDLDVWTENSEKRGCSKCGSRSLRMETSRCDCNDCYDYHQDTRGLNRENAMITCKGCGEQYYMEHFLSEVEKRLPGDPVWAARRGIVVDLEGTESLAKGGDKK